MDDPHVEVEIKPQLKYRGSVAKEEDSKPSHARDLGCKTSLVFNFPSCKSVNLSLLLGGLRLVSPILIQKKSRSFISLLINPLDVFLGI